MTNASTAGTTLMMKLIEIRQGVIEWAAVDPPDNGPVAVVACMSRRSAGERATPHSPWPLQFATARRLGVHILKKSSEDTAVRVEEKYQNLNETDFRPLKRRVFTGDVYDFELLCPSLSPLTFRTRRKALRWYLAHATSTRRTMSGQVYDVRGRPPQDNGWSRMTNPVDRQKKLSEDEDVVGLAINDRWNPHGPPGRETVRNDGDRMRGSKYTLGNHDHGHGPSNGRGERVCILPVVFLWGAETDPSTACTLRFHL